VVLTACYNSWLLAVVVSCDSLRKKRRLVLCRLIKLLFAYSCGCVQKRGGFRPIKCCSLVTVTVYRKRGS
jgi:hypothetical protein